VRIRRRQTEETPDREPASGVAEPEVAEAEADEERVPGPRAAGPWDSAEVTLDPEDPTKVDLGGLIVTGRPGLELRLQVDEGRGQVAAVLLAGPEGAVELRPFAAPRNGDIWDDARKSLAAEDTRQGGTATEADGPNGPELRVVMNVTTPEGKVAAQPSRVLGIAGPRWLLRATLFGKPAVEPDPDNEVEAALRDVIVVRGSQPYPPGEALPLTVPANAQRVDPGA
jgi:hypothetical protein